MFSPKAEVRNFVSEPQIFLAAMDDARLASQEIIELPGQQLARAVIHQLLRYPTTSDNVLILLQRMRAKWEEFRLRDESWNLGEKKEILTPRLTNAE